jgi:CO/xanthine dehydrogenase Mo-binding subunit
VVRTDGIAPAIAAVAPGLRVDEVDVAGPPTSSALRAAGWAEAAVLLASLRQTGPDEVRAPSGAVASAAVDDEQVRVRVCCGDPLDAVVLRSYCIGAAHMALGWVRSEGIAVDAAGEAQDLTIRSFGILRAVDTPPIDVEIEADDGPPVNGSDAVFAAVAAAAWRHLGHPEAWPAGRR